MPQYSSEVSVITWDYGGPTHPGHAAIKYTGVPGLDGAKANGYISFWPDSGANFFNALNKITPSRSANYRDDQWAEMGESTEQKLKAGIFQPNNDQHSVTITDPNGGPDTIYWLQKASHKIHIPGKNLANVAYGLDLVAMYEWWRIFSNSPGLKYKFASKKINCAGVVLVGLIKAGAAQFADIPVASLYIDPNQVRQFALDVQQEVADLNLNASAMDIAVSHVVANRFKASKVTDVMDYQSWKGMTALGGEARTHVADIDTALKNYHAGKTGTPAKKVKRLGELLKAIRKHIMKYPLSRRGGPVMELGKQALQVTRITTNANNLTNIPWYNQAVAKLVT